MTPGTALHPRVRLLHSVSLMVASAFVIRLIVVLFSYSDLLNPDREYYHFGWEMGRVAKSLASGHGFGSPFFGDTGPTALLPPLYPWLLSIVFRGFGIYSKHSAIAILVVNSIFSALTVIPVVRVAALAFGPSTALRAGWLWAFYPYAIFFSSAYVWSHALSAFELALLTWLTIHLSQSPARRSWLLYGLLWGISGLTNPALLALLPFFLGWIGWCASASRRPWKEMLLAALLCVALLLPWVWRNYAVFGRLIPLRDNFWFEFWVGNTGDVSDVFPDWAHPSTSPSEMRTFRDVGELAYMDSKKPLVLNFIREHPADFAGLVLRRIAFTWTGFWSFRQDYLAKEPFAIPNGLFCSLLSLFAFLGVRKMVRAKSSPAVPLVMILLIYPLLYYLTHMGMDYRHGMDPALVVLIAYCFSKQSSTPPGPAERKRSE